MPHPTFQELKHQTEVTLNIVHCPPVTTAVIRRPDSKYQLGFCVENGVVSACGMGAGPGSTEGQAEPVVSRDQCPAPTLHVPAQAEGSQGSAVRRKKLLTAFLQHWWLYPSAWCSAFRVEASWLSGHDLSDSCCCPLCPSYSLPWAFRWLCWEGREGHSWAQWELGAWVSGMATSHTNQCSPRTGHVGLSCCPREQLSLCSPSLRGAGRFSESSGGQNPGGCPGPSPARHWWQ